MNNEDQRRYLTILFSDLVGSTQLAARVETEDFAVLLNSIRRVFENALEMFGGTILRIQGDGVLAVFGYPATHESDALDAVKAALKMHEDVLSILPTELGLTSDASGLQLRLHTGIHSGLSLLQDGDVTLGRFELLGSAANHAAALCQSANPNEILLSAESMSPNLRRFIDYETVTVSLKGLILPVTAIKPLRLSELNYYSTQTAQGDAEFLGRADEMGQLCAALESVFKKQNRFVHISGEPGIGKTCLVRNFLSSIDSRRTRLLQGVCGEGAAAAFPFQPFIRMLSAFLALPSFQFGETDENFLGYFEVERRVMPFFREWSRQLPIVLFFDDWQWADSATRRLVNAIIKDPHVRTLIIVTSRNANDLLILDAVTAFRLEPLSEESSFSLAFAAAPGLSPFELRSLVQDSGGNPLLIKELSRYPREHPVGPNRTSLGAGAGIAIWLNSLYETRLSVYGELKSVWIRAASVIGLSFSPELLALVIEAMPGEDFYIELSSQHLIDRDPVTGDYHFRHGLIRDAIYASVGLRRRRALHLKIAQLLEGQRQGSYTSYQSLSYHFFEGASFEKAAFYAEAAADLAHKMSLLDSAQAQYQVALKALGRLQKSVESHQSWERVLNRYALSCVFDPAPEPIEVFTNARTKYLQRADINGKARAEYMLAYLNYALGRPFKALQHGEEALETLKLEVSQSFVLRIKASLGHANVALCNYQRARPLLEGAIAAHRASEKPKVEIVLAYNLVCLGALLADVGEYESSDEKFNSAREALKGQTHEMVPTIESRYSAVLIWQQRWDEALESAQKASEVAGKVRSLYLYAMGKALEAYILWTRTRDDKYINHLVEATHWLTARSREQFLSLNFGWLAGAAQEMGNEALLRSSYARALLRARKGDVFGMPMAARAMAKNKLSRSDESSARRYFDRAVSVANSRGSVHEQAANRMFRDNFGLPERI